MKILALVAAGICLSSAWSLAEPTAGQSYRFNLTDIDGDTFSSADGHITTLVVTSKANVDKAHAVGDRVPDFCLLNQTYRMITVVVFDPNHSRPVRALLTSMMRRRVDLEARQLQARYEKLKITRDARRDVVAVPDFNGAIAGQLELKPGAGLFHVLVFGKGGELLKQWDDVPSADDLSAALK